MAQELIWVQFLVETDLFWGPPRFLSNGYWGVLIEYGDSFTLYYTKQGKKMKLQNL
jgi:hypothetical protein